MTIFTNIALAGSIKLIWSFVNALQMILFVAMCEINFPSTVKILYKLLLPLASLDIIPSEISTDLLFSFSGEINKPYSKRFEELGLESHNMIKNVGSMFYYISATIIALFIAIILKFFSFKNKNFRKIKKILNWKNMLNHCFIIF